MSPGARCRGFTLVEVLVALAIVTIGLAALMGAASQTVRTSSYLRDKMFAEWIALNKLTETRMAGTLPAQTKSEGEIEYANQRWRWELEKVQTPVDGIVRLESRVARVDVREGTWTAHATGFMGTAITLPQGATAGGLMWAGNPATPPGGQPGDESGRQPGHGEGHGPPPESDPNLPPPPPEPGEPQQ